MALSNDTILSFAKLPPIEAISYLQEKGFKLTFDYEEMMWEAHHKAFTVAKISREDLLRDIRDSITAAQREGTPFGTWKKQLRPTLAKKGWWGKVDAVNPVTGEVKEISVGTRRLRTIYYTNMRVAYQAGRAKQIYNRETIQYVRYIAILDNRTRPSHASMHDKVLPKDHPWWKTHWPPNGWNCRCRVSPVSAGSVERYREAGSVIESDSMPPTIADHDWAYDVREGGADRLEALRRIKTDKLQAPFRTKAEEEIASDELLIKSIDTDIDPTLKSYLLANRPKLSIDTQSSIPAGYNTKSQTILLRNATVDLLTFRHELGHHIDQINGSDGKLWSENHLTKKITRDTSLWTNAKKDKLGEILSGLDDAQIHDLFYLSTQRKFGAKTRNDRVKITKRLMGAEAFANIFQTIVTGDESKLGIIREYFPQTFSAIEQLLKELK